MGRTYDTKTILIANQKGGVGKTWIADELCFMCENSDMPYTLRDYDGQGGLNHKPVENDDPALVIIDTPGALQPKLNEWIREADLILVPTLMTKQCMEPLERMIEILKPWKRMGKKAVIVMNQWDRYTACADFEEWFFAKYPEENTVTLSDSEVIKQAIEHGKSVVNYRKYSKSASEMMAFYTYVMNVLYKEKMN